MKRFTVLFLCLLAFRVHGADVAISDLTQNSNPSTNTWIEISDMNASPKSGKYLLTSIQPTVSVTYASTITIDFAGFRDLWTVLGGDVTLASTGLSAGKSVQLRIDNTQATNCNIIVPSTWRMISGTVTNILAPSQIGLLWVKSYAANNTNCVALWSSE